jgi:hypothetical protein
MIQIVVLMEFSWLLIEIVSFTAGLTFKFVMQAYSFCENPYLAPSSGVLKSWPTKYRHTKNKLKSCKSAKFIKFLEFYCIDVYAWHINKTSQ